MNPSNLPRRQLKKLIAEQTLTFDQIKDWITDNGCLIIGVGMLKGGTGKTTTTIFLALFLTIVLDLRVCVVDTDENSQSVDEWHKVRDRRDEKVPFDLHVYDVTGKETPDLDNVLEDLSESYDVVIVDLGGATKEVYFELCLTAHALVLPLAPSGYESSRLLPTIQVANRGAKAKTDGRLQIFALFVKCSGNSSLPEEERAAVEALLPQAATTHADVHLVPPEFQLSASPYYPRSWRGIVRRSHLHEIGWLVRHVMRVIDDRQRHAEVN